MKKKDLKSMPHTKLPYTFASDLKGRQSVRTTFKLTESTINAVSIVAAHLGIKQKSLFDHLMDDIEVLNTIASEIKGGSIRRPQPRVQKTYVISRRSLACLEQISKDHKTPRDVLVELSIQRLMPLIEEEKEKHKRRKSLQIEILKYLNEGIKILTKAENLLGREDPVYEKIASTMAVCEHNTQDIENFIKKGEIIEEF